MFLVRLGCVLFVCSCNAEDEEQQELELLTEDEKVLYALGLSIGRSHESFHLSEEDLKTVVAGFEDQVAGRPPKVELDDYIGKVRDLAKARGEAFELEAKDRGEKFLADLAGTAGAVRTASGLVYIETQPGTGATPKPTDVVTVNFRGTLVDGTEFDSSYARQQPVTFPLNEVRPCWTEGLQMMKVGGKAKLGCPASLAFGDKGDPPRIPGGAALVLEIELLSIGPVEHR